MRKLSITTLVDNIAGSIGYAEHGLSLHIKNGNEQFLFDVGASDLFIKNAALFNIPLEQINTIILSHGHWDHGNGLEFINHKTILTHPNSFLKRYRNHDHSYIGLSKTQEEISEQHTLQLSTTPIEFSEHLWFLGSIPRNNNFESKITSFTNEEGTPDFVPDDSAIVYKSANGLVVISGCAHAGICNTVEYSKQVTSSNKVHAIIGGFHLKDNDKQTQETITYLQKENIKHLFPMHCTNFKAKAAINSSIAIKELLIGATVEF